ncbi:MAG TPA: sugar transferase [Alphaproteobacteria bacterium]|nr:sugar transferase [Alphaproteobacteria bacterium]
MAKRFLDIVISFMAVLLLLPVYGVIFLLCRLLIGSPVFFRHRRPGLNGESFLMCKFRTMVEKYDDAGELLPDEQRMTSLGSFLRATSLDELPELINVIKGEMSLVGPRPLLMEYLPLYSTMQSRRHEVRPGITGWAQVNGRNTLSWQEKFDLDIWYVDHQSIFLDMKILLLTIKKVMQREGISAAGEATMPKFTGNKC